MAEQLGLRLKQMRQANKMTQEKLAELAGVHPTYIPRIEAGKALPSLVVIRRLADVLGVRVSSVVEAVDEPKSVHPEKELLIRDLVDILEGCPEKEVRLMTEIARVVRNSG